MSTTPTLAAEDQHKFSAHAVACLRAMGEHVFSNPLASWPWGGRPHVSARRFVLQKYLTNEDLIAAYWVEETEKRRDPNYWHRMPGLSHLSKLMDMRSGLRWRAEMDEIEKAAPTVLDHMEAEWGEETRRAQAVHRQAEVGRRRSSLHLVTDEIPVDHRRERIDAAVQKGNLKGVITMPDVFRAKPADEDAYGRGLRFVVRPEANAGHIPGQTLAIESHDGTLMFEVNLGVGDRDSVASIVLVSGDRHAFDRLSDDLMLWIREKVPHTLTNVVDLLKHAGFEPGEPETHGDEADEAEATAVDAATERPRGA